MELLRAPAWPQLVIETTVEPEIVAERLASAAAEKRYWEPFGRESLGYLRLSGSVDGRAIDLRAKPYAVPPIPAGSGNATLAIRGKVVPGTAGAEIHAELSVPMPRIQVGLAVGWIVLLVVLGFGQFGPASLVMLGVLPIWYLIIRSNQGQVRNREPDVVAFLREIAEGGRPPSERR